VSPNPTKVAWAAGFFDGEGCIVIRKKLKRKADPEHPHNHFLFVHVSNTQRAPLDEFVALWGGGIVINHRRSEANSRPCWRWQSSTRQAAAALRDMLPYLVVKREEAEVALAFQERRVPPGAFGGQMPRCADPAQDHLDYLTLQSLKRRVA